MYKSKLATSLFLQVLLISAAVLAMGCADANAATATYLPANGDCTSDEQGMSEAALEWPDPIWELDDTGHDGAETNGDEALDDERIDHDRGDDDLADTAWVADEEGGSEAPGAAAPAPININRASADQLTELPGIGPALAERIIEYRRQRQFDAPRQLQRIRGIGPAKWEKIRPQVSVD